MRSVLSLGLFPVGVRVPITVSSLPPRLTSSAPSPTTVGGQGRALLQSSWISELYTQSTTALALANQQSNLTKGASTPSSFTNWKSALQVPSEQGSAHLLSFDSQYFSPHRPNVCSRFLRPRALHPGSPWCCVGSPDASTPSRSMHGHSGSRIPGNVCHTVHLSTAAMIRRSSAVRCSSLWPCASSSDKSGPAVVSGFGSRLGRPRAFRDCVWEAGLIPAAALFPPHPLRPGGRWSGGCVTSAKCPTSSRTLTKMHMKRLNRCIVFPTVSHAHSRCKSWSRWRESPSQSGGGSLASPTPKAFLSR